MLADVPSGTAPTPSLYTRVVAEALRIEAARRNWSDSELSRRCGIPRTTLGPLLRGEKAPSTDQLVKITDAFGLEVLEVMAEAQRLYRTAAPTSSANAGEQRRRHDVVS